MNAAVDLRYTRLPALLPSYGRAALTLSDRQPGADTMPALTAHVSLLTAKPARLAKYRRVCAFADTRYMPVTYPHVLAFPVQMALMTHKQFPFRVMGLIHVRNVITQHRLIADDEMLDLGVHLSEPRPVRHGLEFDLITHVTDCGGHAVWQEAATMLSRRRHPRARNGVAKKQTHDESRPEPSHHVRWDIAADIGRRYAFAAGDFNPIHLSALTARLFGFGRAIATGMWLKARVAAELTPQLSASAYEFSLRFKRPVFLPAAVELGYVRDTAGVAFTLRGIDTDTEFLQGNVSYL